MIRLSTANAFPARSGMDSDYYRRPPPRAWFRYQSHPVAVLVAVGTRYIATRGAPDIARLPPGERRTLPAGAHWTACPSVSGG
jgi:hypothetical protein